MDKKTGEILGLVIGIIGLLIALAALAVAIPQHSATAAVAVFGGGIGVAVGYWLFKRARSLPSFSIQTIKSTFRIIQANGSECIFSKDVRFRCNYSGQRHFTHRNIYADGDGIRDFRWNGPGFLEGPVKKMASEYNVHIAYEPAWPVNKDFEGALSYSAPNAFLGNLEWVAYLCDRRGIERATMEIHFPRERACTRAWACQKSLGGEVTELGAPEVSEQGTKVSFVVNDPKVGSEYHVYWEW